MSVNWEFFEGIVDVAAIALVTLTTIGWIAGFI
jgi:hypothetical protein